jgi:hypothetical protein
MSFYKTPLAFYQNKIVFNKTQYKAGAGVETPGQYQNISSKN